MAKDFRATTLERAIGRQLAGWRDERSLSLAEASQRVGFSSAKLSMMENAEQIRTRTPGNTMSFDTAADFANLVFEATELRAFTTDLVPTVLQLPGYTNAVMQNDDSVRTARLAMVREAQLLHLMEVSERQTVSVQVVPRGAGAYPAMGSPFTLLGFPHRQHNDVAYLETFIKGEYVEDPGLTEQCAQRFGELQEVALGAGESLELIAEAAAEL